MQHKWFLLVAGVALASNSTAHAGAPPWCKETGKFDPADYASGKDDIDRVRYLVDHCQGDSEKARAEESKRLSMIDADWNDAAAWVNAQGYSHSGVGGKPAAGTFATLSPIDQYLVIHNGLDDYQHGADAMYLADALEQNLTEAGRFAFLESCNLGGDPEPATWAICLPDAAKFNAAKFASEVRGDSSHTPLERFALHLKLGQMIDTLAHFKQAGPELIKKDDGYKKLFDAAAQAQLDWRNTLGTMTDLLAVGQQVDSAMYFHSKKQFGDCDVKSEKALADAVSKIPAKAFEGMHDPTEPADLSPGFVERATNKILTYPEANLAAGVFALCEPDRAWAIALASKLEDLPGQRGPRTAAYSAIASQTFELDDTRAKEVHIPPVDSHKRPYEGTSGLQSWSGVVASMKPGKNKQSGAEGIVLSNPKTSMTTQDCVKWHETRKLTGWDTAGRPTYEQICDKIAAVKHDTTTGDAVVTAKSAKMVKVGMRYTTFYSQKLGLEEVFAVWPSKTAKLPSNVLGGAVK